MAMASRKTWYRLTVCFCDSLIDRRFSNLRKMGFNLTILVCQPIFRQTDSDSKIALDRIWQPEFYVAKLVCERLMVMTLTVTKKRTANRTRDGRPLPYLSWLAIAALGCWLGLKFQSR